MRHPDRPVCSASDPPASGQQTPRRDASHPMADHRRQQPNALPLKLRHPRSAPGGARDPMAQDIRVAVDSHATGALAAVEWKGRSRHGVRHRERSGSRTAAPPSRHRLPNTACLRGQVCGTSARAEWPVLGSRGTAGWGRPARSWWRWLPGGPGSAATSWSRCCGGSSGAVPGWLSGRAGPGVFMGARAWVLGARGRSPSCWPPGGPGRPWGGGRIGLAA